MEKNFEYIIFCVINLAVFFLFIFENFKGEVIIFVDIRVGVKTILLLR